MEFWDAIFEVLTLLLPAAVLGSVFERFRQNALVGYLLSGALVGPHGLNLIANREGVAVLAELGVALMLFSIGLEFSLRRVLKFGAVAIGGGAFQVLVTAGCIAVLAGLAGFDPSVAVVLGAIIALSSTACVLRVLAGRAELDSTHGRFALGILLFQDIAAIPLVMLASLLSESGQNEAGMQLVRVVGGGVGLAVGLHVFLNRVLPVLLAGADRTGNRELITLGAALTAVGAAWLAHRLHISPALGAFLAGTMLAESPFSTQIRAEVAPLRTLFVTLFFSSIGMLADLRWALDQWVLILSLIGLVLAVKTLVAAGAIYIIRRQTEQALATGLCLSQVGEFSFVIAEAARRGALLNEDWFKTLMMVVIGTLFLTPYLCAGATRIARRGSGSTGLDPWEGMDGSVAGAQSRPLVIGFGPAARRLIEELQRDEPDCRPVVLEMNRSTAALAEQRGIETFIGDAGKPEVLRPAMARSGQPIVITIPDTRTALHVSRTVRGIRPDARLVVRLRYDLHKDEFPKESSLILVNEEEVVGGELATVVRRMLADDGE